MLWRLWNTQYSTGQRLLSTFKEKLTKCQQGEMNQFSYGIILASFFFERVPHLRLQVDFNELRADNPCMVHWVEVMARHGDGGSKVKYGSAFFRWLDDQLLMIEDYTYARTDIKGGPDLAQPAGAHLTGISLGRRCH